MACLHHLAGLHLNDVHIITVSSPASLPCTQNILNPDFSCHLWFYPLSTPYIILMGFSKGILPLIPGLPYLCTSD